MVLNRMGVPKVYITFNGYRKMDNNVTFSLKSAIGIQHFEVLG